METRKRKRDPSLDIKQSGVTLLVLPLGWTPEEEKQLPHLLHLAQVYVSFSGFLVFQKDEEFAAWISHTTHLPYSLNTARLLLLYTLSSTMFDLGKMFYLFRDKCEYNVDCFV